MNLLTLNFTMKELDWWPCNSEETTRIIIFQISGSNAKCNNFVLNNKVLLLND